MCWVLWVFFCVVPFFSTVSWFRFLFRFVAFLRCPVACHFGGVFAFFCSVCLCFSLLLILPWCCSSCCVVFCLPLSLFLVDFLFFLLVLAHCCHDSYHSTILLSPSHPVSRPTTQPHTQPISLPASHPVTQTVSHHPPSHPPTLPTS